MFYLVKTPFWLRKLFPGRIWDFSGDEKAVYLSFDDGPHPEHTAFVLDELKKYNGLATFFCIGKNVALYPETYQRILDEGHTTGNHTQNHRKEKVKDADYISDVAEAEKQIDSNLFRPPYGKLTNFRAKLLRERDRPMKIIMWSVLSGDFDPGITAKRCIENVLFNTVNGSLIVFHDSEKASEKLKEALPVILKSLHAKGFSFKRIVPEPA